jgi:hypothetical protein
MEIREFQALAEQWIKVERILFEVLIEIPEGPIMDAAGFYSAEQRQAAYQHQDRDAAGDQQGED